MKPSQRDGGLENIGRNARGYPMWSLFVYCLRYWKTLGMGVTSAIVYRVTRLVPPILVAVAIDRVIDAPGNPGLLADLGILTTDVIPAGEISTRIGLLETLVLLAVGAYLLRAVARFFARYLIQSTAQKIQHDLRNDTYRHMQSLSLSFFDNHETGGMMSILNNDINRLEDFLNTELTQIIRVVTIVLGIGSVMLYVYPKMALIALIPVPIIGFASGSFLIWIDKKYQEIRETVGRLSSRLANNLGGIKVIKAFNRYAYERDRVSRQSQQYRDEQIGALKIRRAYFAGLRLTTGFAFVTILYFGGHDVIDGAISIGTFTLFFLFLRRLYGPMRRIGRTANKYQQAKSSAERIFGLMGLEASIQSPDDPIQVREMDGSVQFEDVSFSYNERDYVIKDVSISVDAGETIGLVGETGSGKSTLLKLIPRFYDVDEGRVCVDGIDVRRYDLQDLRNRIAIVDQDPYLFSGTVIENIAYGDREVLAQFHDGSGSSLEQSFMNRVEEAAKIAEADRFIQSLPNGYWTEIGERGVKLSGGQRQRISIARAVMNDPAIIIFDEATSDVDTTTEELIQKSLNKLCRNRTAFLIAHRLSTVQKADRIFVLRDGSVVETGTHESLLSRDGYYSELWSAQTEDDRPMDVMG